MERFTFLGVPISATNKEEVIHILTSTETAPCRYVCFPDSFVIRAASQNEQLLRILSESWMTLPDGKPSQWFANRIGQTHVRTVSGYDVCMALLETNKTHFFYGGNEAQLEAMHSNMKKQFPHARILGMHAPPMVDLMDIAENKKIQSDLEHIASLQPDFIWIGISSPKQDVLMQHAKTRLSGGILLGVGGVFNYIANPKSKSPEWMKRMGLRWLYRAVREPKRLAGKYLGMLWFIATNLPRILSDIRSHRKAAK